ncbi:paladin-like [Amblyraja radiata]|uniref:paladin-like n=1 Tax=Amblyraja radiata TaxID=386614 RepID=UPI0014026093|nr:paladin-like [Amblyraja radiata]
MNLNYFFDDVTKNVDEDRAVDVVSVVFSMAFDTVPRYEDTMGTSASTNQQSASSVRAQPEKDVKQPVAVSHSEVINTPAGLAKSFVTNKVARVVITHNLKEEFQVHDNFLKAHYVIGSMNDSLPEHYLVQGKYFMINDLSDKVDNLLTMNNYGAPNFRQIQLGYPVYGMGQATMNGFHMVLQKLKEEGNQEIIYFNVREEPVIFLHQDDDFIPYTPRDRNDLQENLYNLTSRDQVENLELIIKNELLDFAVLSNQTYFVYHGTEQFVTEPLPKTIENVEDVRISEEVYRGHVFTMPYFRYKRLPLPVAATLEEADFDSFISTVRVDSIVNICSEMLNLKESIFLYKDEVLKSDEWYQKPLADEYLDLDEMSSRRQMKVANYRKVSKMPVCGIAQPNPEGLLRILSHLTDDTRKFTRVLCLNLRGEAVLEADGQMYSLREVNNLQQEVIIPATTVEQLEEIEAASKMDLLSSKTPIETWKEETKEMKQFNSCMTLKEVYSQAAIQYPQLQNHRIPIPDCAAPTEEEFDVFLNVVRSHLITDQNTVIVLNCHDGKGRTTAGMAISLLLVWHIKGFPEFIVEDMVSIPDAKYTKGEYEAVLSLVRILPNGNGMKQEVDRALDAVSDSMTPMMHHLRELILNTYKKSKGAKDKDTAESLHLCSLQYLERYLYLILFDTYLHLEKPGKWERTFKDWMTEVAAPAGVFEILDNLGFSEFEDPGCTPMCRMRNRWQQQRGYKVPTFGDMI